MQIVNWFPFRYLLGCLLWGLTSTGDTLIVSFNVGKACIQEVKKQVEFYKSFSPPLIGEPSACSNINASQAARSRKLLVYPWWEVLGYLLSNPFHVLVSIDFLEHKFVVANMFLITLTLCGKYCEIFSTGAS